MQRATSLTLRCSSDVLLQEDVQVRVMTDRLGIPLRVWRALRVSCSVGVCQWAAISGQLGCCAGRRERRSDARAWLMIWIWEGFVICIITHPRPTPPSHGCHAATVNGPRSTVHGPRSTTRILCGCSALPNRLARLGRVPDVCMMRGALVAGCVLGCDCSSKHSAQRGPYSLCLSVWPLPRRVETSLRECVCLRLVMPPWTATQCWKLFEY